MSHVLHILIDGGPFVYIVLAVFIVCGVGSLFRAGLARWLAFPGLGGGLVAIPLVVGLAGTHNGWSMAFEAVAYAAADQKAALLGAGLAIGLYTTWVALVATGLVVLPNVLAWILGRGRAPGSYTVAGYVVGALPLVPLAVDAVVTWMTHSRFQAALMSADTPAGGTDLEAQVELVASITSLLTAGTILDILTLLLAFVAILVTLVLGVVGLVMARRAEQAGEDDAGLDEPVEDEAADADLDDDLTDELPSS